MNDKQTILRELIEIWNKGFFGPVQCYDKPGCHIRLYASGRFYGDYKGNVKTREIGEVEGDRDDDAYSRNYNLDNFIS